MSETILRLSAVKARIGLSRSSIYQLVSQSRFPRPVARSSRSVGWLESEIDGWLAAQVAISRQTQKP
ncbi:MAG: AlpA family phage regulatory protein [Betaproteobacteria bacterium]